MSQIKNNIEEIKRKIDIAAKKSGRKYEDITLIAVTKTVDVPRIKEALSSGICHIGENKVQEIMRKYEHIDTNIHWHLIGHLQTNKVKYIIDKVDLIHSVDSERLAYKINEQAAKKGKIMDILLQVNVAKEKTKFGLFMEEVEPLIDKVKNLENIRVKGLMTIAPYVENPEENRTHFRNLKQLSVDISKRNIDNISMEILSMGMTNDYEVAIEEGATMVRIGTGIFGERNYN
ncbi:YggS family pyridoxal phosphate-dependent enzyme [Defluviitalea phaphyphila]|uniref:YggS family pyridoxal phosphate-dependent enzyme n=1 Tax=Defluviitalea phaphyphila TaxID=1473580 RepID=UPI0007301E05|nr:YggS family pyridoxal phosphate-dependent enzyme [Defluviitalea phaphyphila]